MEPTHFNLRSGKVRFWVLDRLDDSKPLTSNLQELTEDLVQVSFGAQVLLDVGWYPECSASGSFVVAVVENGDWDAPIFRAEAATLAELVGAVESGARVAEDRKRAIDGATP